MLLKTIEFISNKLNACRKNQLVHVILKTTAIIIKEIKITFNNPFTAEDQTFSVVQRHWTTDFFIKF